MQLVQKVGFMPEQDLLNPLNHLNHLNPKINYASSMITTMPQIVSSVLPTA